MYASSSSVYGLNDKTPFSENDMTDNPANLYGATKLCSDKIFTSSNKIIGKKNISFSVVRYGNVFGSRGSIVPIFQKNKQLGETPLITDKNMTRFNISLEESINMVFWAISNMKGGEIFIPKLKAYRVLDLKDAIFGKNHPFKIIGKRIGEKINEDLITSNEALNTFDLGKYFAIIDYPKATKEYDRLAKEKKIKKVKSNFEYRSDNQSFLSVSELKKLFKQYIN